MVVWHNALSCKSCGSKQQWLKSFHPAKPVLFSIVKGSGKWKSSLQNTRKYSQVLNLTIKTENPFRKSFSRIQCGFKEVVVKLHFLHFTKFEKKYSAALPSCRCRFNSLLWHQLTWVAAAQGVE